ncbi:chitosanase [Aromatoleum toluclasticum]|uniref:chitosanase n=1 Tax=Aromatoleum toluclasticum TaxID=92003 RepID=UPI001D1964BE|nr:chitosanase [Aromatoleum toluclasticum]MCC4118712.1 chitosanase [Aromatoleum toluclasticum]
MADERRKDLWDKVASVTPLVLGIAVTGVGALFTQVYNFRQLQLNQIAALDKLRPLLTSDKPEEREFGYASFAALGYEDIAVRIVQLKKDESGRSVLVELQRVGSPQVQANAADALRSLDEAQKLVNIAEFGTPEPSEAQLKTERPEQRVPYARWAQQTARDLGVSSKLAVAILYDTAIQIGQGRARKLQAAASERVPPPLSSREKEAAWLDAFLDLRDKAMQQGALAKFYPSIKPRIDRLRGLVEKGDWDLDTVATVNGSVEAGAPNETRPSP